MKKVTNFIVNKRYFIIVICIILAIICGIISQKVNVNYDITKYLPNTSETRIGLDIMEKEFAGTETSSFSLMFKDLPENEKNNVYNYLNELDGVKEIDYNETEDYNKDGYTLYVITVDDDADSEVASRIYEEVTNNYKDYETYTSGDVAERNTPVLAKWVVALAIFCALIILIIMCDSYIEPVLFLFSILLAVLFNKGTNIIFPSVSNITESISAILQLALSMDYSIMLMNRYNQEKQNEPNNVKAMKSALYNAFKAISSSSLTTIVGLIVLVFMSFKIGRDLGLILAKGVLFSLISIFFVLPGLILIFDKWIVKTKKKSPNIKLDWLGKFSYKIKYISIPIFLIVFVGSYILKGNLQILYTNSESEEISKIFKSNNQVAIIYKNEDEEKISKIIDDIENEEKIDEILAYSNTINEELHYDNLKGKLNDLGSNVDISDYLIKMLYYDYYSKNKENVISFEEFVNFIKKDVYSNSDIADQIDSNKRKDIDRLENFVHESSMNEKKTASEIAEIMGIEKSKVDDLLIYYSAKNDNIKISINDFINFINSEVLKESKYSSEIDKESREKINKLSKYINKSTIQTPITSSQMAKLFEIDKEKMADLYKYYINTNEINTKLTLSEFSEFMVNNVLNNKDYASSFNNETISNIKSLETFSNVNTIKNNISCEKLAELFGVDKATVTKVLFLKYGSIDDGSSMTVSNFIKNVIYLKNNTNYLMNNDITNVERLYIFANNENNINTTPMDKVHLSNIFDNVSKGLVDKIYLLSKLPDTYTMTPQEFVNLVINNISNMTAEEKSMLNVDDNSLNNLKLLKLVIDDRVSGSGTKYTSSEISEILGIPVNKTVQLYGLINLTQGNTLNWSSTPYEFVNLILNNSNNENIKSNIDESTLAKLNLVANIMKSSLNNENYTYNQIADFIQINKDSAKNVYTLYVAQKDSTKITPQEFVEFILLHKDDKTLNGKFSASQINELTLVKNVFAGVINNKKYTNSEISDLLGVDTEKAELLYGLYNTKHLKTNSLISLKQFVEFLLSDVITNNDYSNEFDSQTIEKLNIINGIMKATINEEKYTANQIFAILSILSDDIDENTIELLYTYYGSENSYDINWEMTIEEFVTYLNDEILEDSRFEDFIDSDIKDKIIQAKDTIQDAKELLVADNYSRVVINTKFDFESEETFKFIQKIKDLIKNNEIDAYVIGDSAMAYEMSGTFNNELNFITIITMISIFVVVAITFKTVLAPIILVFIIQCAVYITMEILNITGDSVYFIALLIVQSILMGATIDYAILYTSYYLEHRKSMGVKDAIINSYNKSIHTILNSSSILIIVTLIVANFTSSIAAKICKTISEGTLCSTILILLLLPAMLAACDRFIIKNKTKD